jgi:hypothetical protein
MLKECCTARNRHGEYLRAYVTELIEIHLFPIIPTDWKIEEVLFKMEKHFTVHRMNEQLKKPGCSFNLEDGGDGLYCKYCNHQLWKKTSMTAKDGRDRLREWSVTRILAVRESIANTSN